jgi:hypothetical protein
MEDVLSGRSDLFSAICVRGDNNLNLAMVKRAQSSEKDLEPGLDRLITESRELYSWTVFDGPAIHSSTQTRTLIERIGITVIVARAGKTDRASFSDALAKISDHRPMVLLNDERA